MPNTIKQLYADRKRLEKEAAANRAERKAVNDEIAHKEAEQQSAEAAKAAHTVSPAGIDSEEAVKGT